MIELIGYDNRVKQLQFFPNGELNLACVTHNVESVMYRHDSDADLIHLLLIAKHFKSFGDVKMPQLHIAYMPYSRMDRDEYGGSSCSLRHVGKLIESMNWKSIRVCEPHSDLTLAYLGENAVPDSTFVDRLVYTLPADIILVYPDAGACKRYMKMFHDRQSVTLSKVRDFNTGKITHMSVDGDFDLHGKRMLIVDDLCSYGGTFLMAGKLLKERGASVIELVVTHCEDSVVNGQLLLVDSPVSRVYTTNSILRTAHPNLVVHNPFTGELING